MSRDKARAEKPVKYAEFYDENTYRKAIEHAIAKGNKSLPADEQIPHWTPYQLRHARATELERLSGLDDAQAELNHTTPDVTRRYSHAQKKKRRALALKERNPFASAETAK